MWAHIEPLAGVLRVFADGDQYGEPYVWSATVRYLDAQTVEILGIQSAPQPSTWRAIIALFAAENVDKIVFQRKQPDGTWKPRTINVRKPK